jgi:hypothetical protein
MKTVIWTLTVFSILTLISAAEARSIRPVSQCLFGESYGDIEEMKDAQGELLFRTGESLSINETRLKGLTAKEKELIIQMAGQDGGREQEVLKDFISAEGHIEYFIYQPDYREFVAVYSYPGDNQYGMIFEVKRDDRTGKRTGYQVVVVIGDGDLEDCTATK